jgi:hypothetical protein
MGAEVDHGPGLASHFIDKGLTAEEVDLCGPGLWNVDELA